MPGRDNARSKHPDGARGDPSLPDMTYFEDRGSVYDAPIEVLWDFMEKDEEFHPKAHTAGLRNFEAKDISEVTRLVRCEVRGGIGQWRKMVARITSIRPAVRINEELEGPYAGSKTVYLYSPRGRKTAVDVLFYMRSSELTPEEIRRDRLTTHARSYTEDVPYLRRFVRKHSALRTPPS